MLSKMYINSTFCQFYGFFTLYTAGTHIFTYLAQAIFRYFSTVLYRRKILLTFRLNIIIILLGWIIPFNVTGSLLALSSTYQYEPESRICFSSTKQFLPSVIISSIIFFMPLLTIVALYGLILWNLTQYNRDQTTSINHIRYKRNMKVFHNILISVCIILVCGIPYILSVITNAIGQSPWILYSMTILSISLATTLDSIVLFFTTDKIREIFNEKISFYQFEIPGIQFRRTNQIAPVIS
ncbi:hypothetical protein I4U23_007130 [Adineta vaga]|nr:hypothetical protein I4U23_007130 [Adineta vaga]